MPKLTANTLLQYALVLGVAGVHLWVVDARSTRQPSTIDCQQSAEIQTTPSGEVSIPQVSAPPLDQQVGGGCANSSGARSNGTAQSSDVSQQMDTNNGDVTNDVRPDHVSRRSAPNASAEESQEPDTFLIEWTVFGDWRVLVGLGAFEVGVYIVTVTVVMVLHARQKNQVGSFRDGALTSKYQFTL